VSTPPPLPSSSSPRTPVAVAIGLICLTAALVVIAWRTLWLQDPGYWVRFGAPLVGFFLCGVSFFCLVLGRRNSPSERWIAGIAATVAGVGMLGGLGMLGWEAVNLAKKKFGPLAQKAARSRARNQHGSEGVDAASRPILQEKTALTFSQVAPFYLGWAERHLVGSYQQHGHRDPRWDALVARILLGSMARRVETRDRPGTDEFRGWLEEARSAGCDEPLLTFASAMEEPDSALRIKLLDEAAEKLADRPDTAGALFLIHISAWREHRKSNKKEAWAQATASLKDLRAIFTKGGVEPGDYWVYHQFLLNESGDDFVEMHGQSLIAALEAIPSVEPWFLHRVRGGLELKLAWEARGSGWANTVNQNGWQGFREHLRKARAELTKSWELHPQHPGAAQQMIAVAMGDSSDAANEMRQWFDRAVGARFDYIPAYRSLLWGLRPRWHGSTEAVVAFGQACLGTRRFDTDVPWQFYQAHRDLASEWDEPEAYYGEEMSWEEMEEVIEGYLAESTMQKQRLKTCTIGAVIAEKCGQMTECRRYLEAAGFKTDPEVLQDWALPPTWTERASALGGPAAALVSTAESAPAEQATELFQQALKQLEGTPEADPAPEYIAFRLHALEAAAKLASLPWESLRPTQEQAVTLKERHGRSSWTAEGVFEQHPGSIALAEWPAGTTFEIRGEVEMPEETEAQAGFYVGGDYSQGAGPEWITARLRFDDENDPSVVYSRRFNYDRFVKRPGFSHKCQVLLQVAGGDLTLSIDHRVVLRRRIHVAAAAQSDTCAGLITSTEDQDYIVRWRNLEWRRLPTLAR